jgi:hypothetical protein
MAGETQLTTKQAPAETGAKPTGAKSTDALVGELNALLRDYVSGDNFGLLLAKLEARSNQFWWLS